MKWCKLNALGSQLLMTAQEVYMAMGSEDPSKHNERIRDKLKQLQEMINDLDEE